LVQKENKKKESRFSYRIMLSNRSERGNETKTGFSNPLHPHFDQSNEMNPKIKSRGAIGCQIWD
jgi:hypothetical protein